MAASGGRDSTALLHCTVARARGLGLEVVALHVHHGLMPEADAWCEQVRSQARRWGAGFASRALQGQPARGDSVEAWAREHRYAALAAMAREHGCSLVLLAQHRRDQAETFLLQALRGAGSEGLAAMPAAFEHGGVHFARPWLGQPRAAIDAYLRRHRLRVADDASNADTRYARARVRQALWPVLEAAFPQAETVLATAASHAQHARALADEVAAVDLGAVCDGPALRLAAWAALPPARRRNALRHWLEARLGQGAPQTLVERLLREAPAAAAPARWPAPGANVERRRGRLTVVAGAPLRPS